MDYSPARLEACHTKCALNTCCALQRANCRQVIMIMGADSSFETLKHHTVALLLAAYHLCQILVLLCRHNTAYGCHYPNTIYNDKAAIDAYRRTCSSLFLATERSLLWQLLVAAATNTSMHNPCRPKTHFLRQMIDACNIHSTMIHCFKYSAQSTT